MATTDQDRPSADHPNASTEPDCLRQLAALLGRSAARAFLARGADPVDAGRSSASSVADLGDRS
jgi:hypothetical protein